MKNRHSLLMPLISSGKNISLDVLSEHLLHMRHCVRHLIANKHLQQSTQHLRTQEKSCTSVSTIANFELLLVIILFPWNLLCKPPYSSCSKSPPVLESLILFPLYIPLSSLSWKQSSCFLCQGFLLGRPSKIQSSHLSHGTERGYEEKLSEHTNLETL